MSHAAKALDDVPETRADLKFQSLWADNPGSVPKEFEKISCEIKKTHLDQLSPGDVTVQAHYSSINYKDALAVTGEGKILRHLPLIPGIDVSGVVLESSNKEFKEGDEVLMTGCGLGETRCGGLSQVVRMPADNLIPRPDGLSLKEAMILGTAGFTAGLALNQLEHNGLNPDKGEVLVTGATGGVGSLSLQMLASKGYQPRAWSRKEELAPWLKEMGATEVEVVADKNWQTTPLASSEFAAAIDNVGGEYLSYILPRVKLWGSVASIGLAQSPLLQATVFPFILRGVNLLGISSANCPLELRKKIWQRLASDLKPKNLDKVISAELKLKEVKSYCKDMIAGTTKGRAIVALQE